MAGLRGTSPTRCQTQGIPGEPEAVTFQVDLRQRPGVRDASNASLPLGRP